MIAGTKDSRPRLGYWAPAEGSASGVADYARDLLAALRPHLEICRDRTRDVNLYQLGNNRLHEEIYRRALEHPGVALLHDSTLHHLLLGILPETEYRAQFDDPALADRMWRNRGNAAVDPAYFEHGLLRAVAERSQLVLVHNESARRAVLRQAPTAKVGVVPHVMLTPNRSVDPLEILRCRAGWGVAPSTLVVGLFGYLRETKRLWSTVEALRRVQADVRLVISGVATAELEATLQDPRVIRIPILDEPAFSVALASLDLGLALRAPSAHETSGLAVRFMTHDVPVVLSEPANEVGLPEPAFVAPPGVAEVAQLTEIFGWAAQNRTKLAAVGRAAGTRLRQDHAPERVAESMLRYLLA